MHVSFRGNELSRRDITGPCVFAEVCAGAGIGGTGAAILFGMNPAWLAGLVLGPTAAPFIDAMLFRSATGILLTAGLNAGLVAGAGIGGFVGGII